MCLETQKTCNSQNNPEKNKAEEITLPNFRLCYKTTVTKITWCCNKNKHGSVEQKSPK